MFSADTENQRNLVSHVNKKQSVKRTEFRIKSVKHFSVITPNYKLGPTIHSVLDL